MLVLFGAKDGVLREGPFSKRTTERIAATDVNGDRRADLLVNDDAFKATLALGRGDGTFDDVTDRLAPVPYRIRRSVFADMTSTVTDIRTSCRRPQRTISSSS